MVDRKGQWRAAIRDSQAVSLLRERQSLSGATVRRLQSSTEFLLQHSPQWSFSRARIEPYTEECDALLSKQIAGLRGPERGAAVIASVHSLTGTQARQEVFGAMPASEPSETDLFAYLECIIHGRHIHTGTFKKYEATAAMNLQRVAALVKEGSEDMFPAMWEFLYAVGQLGISETCNPDHHGGHGMASEHRTMPRDLFPDHLIYSVFTRELGRHLKETLDHLRSRNDYVTAYRLTYNLHGAYSLPRARHILTTIFSDDVTHGPTPNDASTWYHMWSVWSPHYRRIHQWSESTNEGLQEHRDQLRPFFALEGPDISGGGRETLRLSTPTAYFAELLQPGEGGGAERLNMLGSLLKDLDFAINVGPSSVRLLVALCLAGPQHPIDHKTIERLEYALLLNDDSKCEILLRYVRNIRHSGQDMSEYERALAVAEALPLIGSSAALRRRWGDNFNIGALAPNVLRQAQGMLCGHLLPEGQPCEPFARAVWGLARALAESTWLHGQWTQGFLATLHGIPEYWKIQRALDAMGAPTATEYERQDHMDFLIYTLGRDEGIVGRPGSAPGPRLSSLPSVVHRTASSSSTPGRRYPTSPSRLPSPWPPRYSHASEPPDPYDDPVWQKTHLSTSEKDFRAIIQDVPSIPAELATRCMRQALKQRRQHLESISQRLSKVTDQNCVRLTLYLAELNANNLLADPCWADLLLHVLRVRHREAGGLLDSVAREGTIEHFSGWIEALRQVLGARFMEPAGEMGFSAVKIRECEERISARRRFESGGLRPLRTVSVGRRISAEVDPVFTPGGSDSASVITPGTSVRSSIRSPDAYLTSPDARMSGAVLSADFQSHSSTVEHEYFGEEKFSEQAPSLAGGSFDSREENVVRVNTSEREPATPDSSSFGSDRPGLPI